MFYIKVSSLISAANCLGCTQNLFFFFFFSFKEFVLIVQIKNSSFHFRLIHVKFYLVIGVNLNVRVSSSVSILPARSLNARVTITIPYTLNFIYKKLSDFSSALIFYFESNFLSRFSVLTFEKRVYFFVHS